MACVALVEDDPKIGEWLSALFQGPDGFILTSIHPSLEHARKYLPLEKLDLLIVDIRLPDGSGVDLVREVHQKKPHLAILVHSMSQESEHLFEALKAGASGYLIKGTSSAEFIECLYDILNGKAPMSAVVARKVIEYFHNGSEAGSGIPRHPRLTDRENDVLGSIARGLAYKEVGQELGIAMDTVRTHTRAIYTKLHVRSAAAAVAKLFMR